MANEFRWPQDFAFGTLSQAISASDTTVKSPEFTTLPVLASGQTNIAIILLDQTLRVHEKLWLYNHASGSDTALVLRAKEDSSARAWPLNTQWIAGPTARDVLGFFQSTTLPADAHVGTRALVSDKAEVWEKTLSQGWLGALRANREDFGRSFDGAVTAIPSGSGYVPQTKTWSVLNTTNASGLLSTSIPNGGFPTRLLGAQLTRIGGVTFWMPGLHSTSTKTAVVIEATTPTGVLASTSIAAMITAIGY